MTKPFSEVLAEMQAMHDRKSQDYGVQADPFANVRASEDFGIPGWLGTIVRLNDKITRIKSFAKNGSLANESLRDSLIDIAVYAAIAVALYDEREPVALSIVINGSDEQLQKVLGKMNERIQHYPSKVAEALAAYQCQGDCENCTCDEGLCICGAGGADIDCPAHGYPNRNDSPEACASFYYHMGADHQCDLPVGHEGAHENWAVAGVQGTVPLQWSGKASVANG